MVVFKIRLNAYPVKKTEVSLTLEALAKKIGELPDCLGCQVFISKNDENELLLVEEWASKKKLDQHLGSELFTILLGTRPLLKEPLMMAVDTVSKRESVRPAGKSGAAGPDKTGTCWRK